MRMMKSAMGSRPVQGPLRGGDDARGRRVHLRFQRGRGGIRHESGPDPLDGRDQLTEQLGLQDRGDLSPRSGELDCIVDYYGSAGSANRLDDRLDVEWHPAQYVDYLCPHAPAG